MCTLARAESATACTLLQAPGDRRRAERRTPARELGFGVWLPPQVLVYLLLDISDGGRLPARLFFSLSLGLCLLGLHFFLSLIKVS